MKKKIVIFADSLATDFFVTTPLETMIRAKRSARKGGWPVKINYQTETYSSVSGYLDPCPASVRLRSKILLGAKSHKQKIKQYLKNHQTHPDMYFTWLGHNNVDWFADLKLNKREKTEYLANYPKEIAVQTIENLKLLVKNTQRPKADTKILISGLVNYIDFFPLRDQKIKYDSPAHYQIAGEIFESLALEHQKDLLKLVGDINHNLQEQCEFHSLYFKENGFNLLFDNKLNSLELKDIVILDNRDAWHLSDQGKEYFAQNLELLFDEYLKTKDS